MCFGLDVIERVTSHALNNQDVPILHIPDITVLLLEVDRDHVHPPVTIRDLNFKDCVFITYNAS